MSDLSHLLQAGFLQVRRGHHGLKGAAIFSVPEYRVAHVESDLAGFCPGGIPDFSGGIDEPPDQPGTGYSVNVGTQPRDPPSMPVVGEVHRQGFKPINAHHDGIAAHLLDLLRQPLKGFRAVILSRQDIHTRLPRHSARPLQAAPKRDTRTRSPLGRQRI